jgi:hypothetical protein
LLPCRCANAGALGRRTAIASAAIVRNFVIAGLLFCIAWVVVAEACRRAIVVRTEKHITARPAIDCAKLSSSEQTCWKNRELLVTLPVVFAQGQCGRSKFRQPAHPLMAKSVAGSLGTALRSAMPMR